MRIRIFFALLLASTATGRVVQAQEQSFVVHHQGRLLNSDDSPVQGVQTITVSLFASELAETAVWEESYETTVGTGGVYAIALGDTKGQRSPLTTDDVSGERWVEVSYQGIAFKPRLRLGASPYALLANDSLLLGGAPASAFLKKDDFDAFKAAITGGGTGVSIPWDNITGVPADIGSGLRQVALADTSLTGDGTTANGLRVASDGIDTAHLKNGAVTPAKLAAGGCNEGQILKFQNNAWQCGADVGGGDTLPFDVIAPLEQVAGSGGSAAKLQLKDGAVNAQKLAEDALALSKVSGGAAAATSFGAIGIGVSNPTARLEVGAYPEEAIAGSGSVNYSAGTKTVTDGAFEVLRIGDSIQLGTNGWRTVTGIPNATTVTLDAGYQNGYGGSWSYRRATLRVGEIIQTPGGDIGIGGAPTLGKFDVKGHMNATPVAARFQTSKHDVTNAYVWDLQRLNTAPTYLSRSADNTKIIVNVPGYYFVTAGVLQHLATGKRGDVTLQHSRPNGSSVALSNSLGAGANTYYKHHVSAVDYYEAGDSIWISISSAGTGYASSDGWSTLDIVRVN